jgi:hypothetical protein
MKYIIIRLICAQELIYSIPSSSICFLFFTNNSVGAQSFDQLAMRAWCGDTLLQVIFASKMGIHAAVCGTEGRTVATNQKTAHTFDESDVLENIQHKGLRHVLYLVTWP